MRTFTLRATLQRGPNVRIRRGGCDTTGFFFSLPVHEAPKIFIRRSLQRLIRTRKNDAPVTQDQHVFRNAGHARQIMADHDQGHFRVCLAHIQQQLIHLGRIDRIEPGGRFIAKKQRRLRDNGAGQSAALLHPAGQFIGIIIGKLGKPYQIQNTQDGRTDSRFGQTGMLMRGNPTFSASVSEPSRAPS